LSGAGDPQNRLHWYGRRRGHKLRPGRQALVENLLPRLRLAPPADSGIVDVRSGSEREANDGTFYRDW